MAVRYPVTPVLLGAIVVAALASGCADPEAQDAGPGADATPGDAGVSDTGATQDTGAGTDTGGTDSGGTDTGGADAGGADIGTTIDGSTDPCNGALTLDGVAYGPIGGDWTLLPASATPTTLTRIAETPPFVAGELARLTSPGALAWHATLTHLTMFDSINYEHVLLDPVDGALYVAIQQQVQDDATGMRFYNGNGTLGVELTRDGTPGMDILGRGRQSNFFLVKYDQAGFVVWVSRFGPNRAGTDRAGSIASIGFTATGVRVVGSVEGATDLVFGPGTASQHVYAIGGPSAFWAELNKTDGGYVAGSARSVSASAGGFNGATLTALAYSAHAGGETAIAGQLREDTGAATFTIGGGGAGTVTFTSTVSLGMFAKIGADGAPVFVSTASGPTSNADPEPRAVGLSPNGEVVAGGQFSIAEGTAHFRDATGLTPVDYAAQNSFVVGYSATGEISWVKVLPTTHRNTVSRILVTADAAYVMGVHVAGQVLGGGEPGEVAVPASGYTLSKYDLDTGAFEWVRVFTNAQGPNFVSAFDVWPSGNNVMVPAGFEELQIVGGRTVRTYDSLGAQRLLGGVILTPSGEVAGCEAIGAGGLRGFRPL